MAEKVDPRWQLIFEAAPFCDYHHAGTPQEECVECAYRKEFFEALDSLLKEHVRMHRSLDELVTLRDGPRDNDYYARRPAAWNNAREIVYEHDMRLVTHGE